MSGASNVYLRADAASQFERASFIPHDEFFKIADYAVEVCSLNTQRSYRILDVGSGTGRMIINMLSRFDAHGINYHAVCFDTSPPMLDKFRQNLEANDKPVVELRLLEHDAKGGLPDHIFPECFDLIFIVAVLHFLDDWRFFMREVSRKLARGGFLILAEITGWYRLMDGSFDELSEADPISVKFWQHYFAEREKYGTWDSELRFSRLSPVTEYCEKSLRLKKMAVEDFTWETKTRWRKVLSWIEVGPASSLGSNIKHNADRKKLSETMRMFLEDNQINMDDQLLTRWGFRVFVMSKGNS